MSIKLSEILKLCGNDCKIMLRYYNENVIVRNYNGVELVNEDIGGYIIEQGDVKYWLGKIDENKLRNYPVIKITPISENLLYICG